MKGKLGSNHKGFAAAMKDIDKITQMIMEDERLCRLMYYTDKDALKKENLTAEQKIELINENQITAVPVMKMHNEDEVKNFIFLGFGSFLPSNNPAFMDVTLSIDIMCHVDNWKVVDHSGEVLYRPYAIAELIYERLKGSKLTGIGYPQFTGADTLILGTNPDYSGLTLSYVCVNFDEQ